VLLPLSKPFAIPPFSINSRRVNTETRSFNANSPFDGMLPRVHCRLPLLVALVRGLAVDDGCIKVVLAL